MALAKIPLRSVSGSRKRLELETWNEKLDPNIKYEVSQENTYNLRRSLLRAFSGGCMDVSCKVQTWMDWILSRFNPRLTLSNNTGVKRLTPFAWNIWQNLSKLMWSSPHNTKATLSSCSARSICFSSLKHRMLSITLFSSSVISTLSKKEKV